MPSLYLLLLAAVLATVAASPREVSRVKRQVPGGKTEDDPEKPEYKKLAQESWEKYQDDHPDDAGNIDVCEIEVEKVTKQVVAGIVTNIDFTVLTRDCESFDCHSETYERAWLNKKDIKVDCDM